MSNRRAKRRAEGHAAHLGLVGGMVPGHAKARQGGGILIGWSQRQSGRATKENTVMREVRPLTYSPVKGALIARLHRLPFYLCRALMEWWDFTCEWR
jgi:hypothetical protein